MTKQVSLKIDQELLDKILIITQRKFPLRNIDKYAEAVREALLDYVIKNTKWLHKEDSRNNIEVKAETGA